MHRRELFRMLAAGSVLPVLSPEVLALLRAAQTASGYQLRTLSPHQNETVLAMIDLIIPVTDTPGAKAARVNEFIDVILSEWAHEDERKNFLDGLAGVDQQSNALFGKDFVQASQAQQVALLRSLDDEALSSNRVSRRGRNEPRGGQMQGSFWKVFKGMTLHGYYTSEIGFTDELKLQIIPGALHGCAPVPDDKKA
jgi:hypothetical protein